MRVEYLFGCDFCVFWAVCRRIYYANCYQFCSTRCVSFGWASHVNRFKDSSMPKLELPAPITGLAHKKIKHNLRMNWLDNIKWDAQGLVPVIAQEQGSGDVLMFAYMNREALQKTAELKRAVYFSRSRSKLWFKGEESGHVQTVHDIRLDCDADVVLLTVTQLGHEPGIACHTGRHSCFFNQLQDVQQEKQWKSVEPVLKDPEHIYK
jgi:phosphoribosyl-AMP cyclohydrolase